MSECPICLEICETDNMVLLECCNMKFCIECLISWFNRNREIICPICHNILENYYIPIAESLPEVAITHDNIVEQDSRDENNLSLYPTTIKYTAASLFIFILVKMIYALSTH